MPDLVMYEEEFRTVTEMVTRLLSNANAKVVFLVDKNGQLITSAGDRKSTRLNSSHIPLSRMPSSA